MNLRDIAGALAGFLGVLLLILQIRQQISERRDATQKKNSSPIHLPTLPEIEKYTRTDRVSRETTRGEGRGGGEYSSFTWPIGLEILLIGLAGFFLQYPLVRIVLGVIVIWLILRLADRVRGHFHTSQTHGGRDESRYIGR